MQCSGLSNSSGLPENVRLLSLEQWDESNVLIRLEHTYELNQDTQYGKAVNVSLKVIVSDFDELVSQQELSFCFKTIIPLFEQQKLSLSLSFFLLFFYCAEIAVRL